METSIKLKRPLAIIELETTGLRPDVDRIVELAILKICPDGRRTQYVQRINPQVPIPPEATAVHGIKSEDVVQEPTFGDVALEVTELLEGCDLGGFNVSNYDLPMLQREFDRAKVEFSMKGRAIVDAKKIFHAKEPRDLEAACIFYLNEPHEEAHTALADARMTWRVINAQLSRYDDLPRDPAGIDVVFNKNVDSEGKFEWKDQNAAFTFGRYRGQFRRDVAKTDPEYLTWMAEKGDFRNDVREIVLDALHGKFPMKVKRLTASL